MVSPDDFLEYLAHFQQRVVNDAMLEASAAYWNRRAEQFEAAKPTATDFMGEADLERRRAQWRRAHEAAKACRSKAELALIERWSSADLSMTAEERTELERVFSSMERIAAQGAVLVDA